MASSESPSAARALSEANLVPPRPRIGVIPRPRLFAALDRFAAVELTLISAPAGSGKTVTVASWLQARPDLTVAWVTIEPGDDEGVRLWTAIATSVDRVRPGVARPALAVLRAPRPDIETAIDELMNGLAGYTGTVVIVLDDLHHLRDEDVMRSVGYGVRRLPPPARLVATTRADPDVGLSRLRARGALGELRAADLAFTADEVEALMAAHRVGALGREDVELLVERTEGWPAAVGLAGIWLSGSSAPSADVHEFSASHTHVSDYLTTEVLDILAPDVRSFLLRTSVLSRFSAPLCDAVTDGDDAAAMLRSIERSNLFLVPLDGRGEWYRYHHLFRELLLAELDDSDPLAAAQLHRRAAEWFTDHGLIEEALDHLALTGDAQLLADGLDAQQRELIRTGRSAVVLQWLKALPDEIILARPVLAATGALTSGLLAEPAAAGRRYSAMAEEGAARLPEGPGMYVRAIVALTRGGLLDRDLDDVLADARLAAGIATAGIPDLVLPTLSVLAYTEFLAGNTERARAAVDGALERSEVAAGASGVVFTHAMQGLLELGEGRLPSAEAAAARAVELGRESGLEGTWSAGLAHHALGEALLAMGVAREAERQLERACTLRQAAEPRLDYVHSTIQLARARTECGKLNLAAADLSAACSDLRGFGNAGILPALAADVDELLAAARASADQLYEAPTPSELSVLQLLDTDLTLREIGEELFLSLNTVKTHSRRLHAKLDCHSRDEVVERAHALGLIAASG